MRWHFLIPRIIAGLLAAGGLFWGIVLAPWIAGGDPFLATLLFGPGYIVTFAYFIRATVTPPLRLRQAIWILSILVQGAWLGLEAVDRLYGHRGGNLVAAWWLGATVASIIALLMERAVPLTDANRGGRW
jgi:hypothetical protein